MLLSCPHTPFLLIIFSFPPNRVLHRSSQLHMTQEYVQQYLKKFHAIQSQTTSIASLSDYRKSPKLVPLLCLQMRIILGNFGLFDKYVEWQDYNSDLQFSENFCWPASEQIKQVTSTGWAAIHGEQRCIPSEITNMQL